MVCLHCIATLNVAASRVLMFFVRSLDSPIKSLLMKKTNTPLGKTLVWFYDALFINSLHDHDLMR